MDFQLELFSASRNIEAYYFYSAVHGVQDTNPEALMKILTKMSINVDSPAIALIQVHLGTTIFSKKGEALLVDYAKAKILNRVVKPKTFKVFQRFLIKDLGDIT